MKRGPPLGVRIGILYHRPIRGGRCRCQSQPKRSCWLGLPSLRSGPKRGNRKAGVQGRWEGWR